ncbi:MAG TPA: hypothetical protein VI981_05320 [Candidatus Paceibacterota bacterium]
MKPFAFEMTLGMEKDLSKLRLEAMLTDDPSGGLVETYKPSRGKRKYTCVLSPLQGNAACVHVMYHKATRDFSGLGLAGFVDFEGLITFAALMQKEPEMKAFFASGDGHVLGFGRPAFAERQILNHDAGLAHSMRDLVSPALYFNKGAAQSIFTVYHSEVLVDDCYSLVTIPAAFCSVQSMRAQLRAFETAPTAA